MVLSENFISRGPTFAPEALASQSLLGGCLRRGEPSRRVGECPRSGLGGTLKGALPVYMLLPSRVARTPDNTIRGQTLSARVFSPSMSAKLCVRGLVNLDLRAQMSAKNG
jgi:hypothetical protein